MSTELTGAVEREIADLESQLAQDPRYIRLQRLRDFLEAERADAARTSRKPRRKDERTAQILDLAARLILNKGGKPVTISAIMREANAAGIVVGKGRKASNRVSAMLSHYKFRSIKGEGWLLPEDKANGTNTEAADPGLEDRESTASADRHQPVAARAQGREAGPGGGT